MKKPKFKKKARESEETAIQTDEAGGEEEITTTVDHLLEVLKTKDKMPLSDAAKALGVSMDVVQSWVDFLVEEQIVGIEYKFTKPFIYLNQTPPPKPQEVIEEVIMTIDEIKREFIVKAQSKNIPEQNLQNLWTNHVQQALMSRKGFFFEEAGKRGIQNIETLWRGYEVSFMREHGS